MAAVNNEKDPITGKGLNRLVNYNNSENSVPKGRTDVDFSKLFTTSSNTSNQGVSGDVNLYNYTESKYDNSVYASDLPNLEALREANQGVLDSLGRSAANLVGKTGINIIGGTVGSIYGVGSAIANGEVSKIWDNSLTTVLDKASEEVGDYFKVYKSGDYESMNMLSKAMLHPVQFTDEVMDTLSFTTGAVLTELLTAGLASGMVIPKALKYLKGLDAVADAGKVAGNMGSISNRILNGLGDAGTLTRQLATGAAWEASVEARQAGMQLRDKMYNDFLEANPDLDNIPEDIKADIDERVSNAGLFTFLTNMALVGSSNMMQFPRIFGAGYNTSKRAVDANRLVMNQAGIYEDALAGLTRNERRLRNTATFLKNPFMEGVVEEGGQAVLSNTAGMYWDRKNDVDSKTNVEQFLNAFSKSLADTYTTAEGWNEIGMGMLIGSLGAPGRGALSIFGKDTKLGQAGFNEDGSRKELWTGGIAGSFQQRNEEDARIAETIDGLNQNTDLLKTMKSHYDFLVKSDSIQKNMDAALSDNDVFSFENFKDDQLHSYINARIEAGLADDLDTTVEQLSRLSNDDFFTSFRGEELAANTSDIKKAQFKQNSIDNLKTRINNTKEAVNTVNSIYQGQNQDLKEELIYNVASAKNIDIREKNINQSIQDLSGGALSTLSIRAGDTISLNQAVKNAKTRLKDPNLSKEDIAATNDFVTNLSKVADNKRKLSIDEFNLIENFIANNPVEASLNLDTILSLLDDSRKLRTRRKNFIDIYNHLFTEQGQKQFETAQQEIIERQEAEIALKEAKEAKKAEDKAIKDRQKEIKDKAAQIKKNEVANKVDDTDELEFTQAEYIPEETDESNITDPVDPLDFNFASFNKNQLAQYLTTNFNEYFADFNAALNRMSDFTNQNVIDQLGLSDSLVDAINRVLIQGENTLTSEESLVNSILDNEEIAEENKLLASDGLVLNDTDVEAKKKELILVDDSRKRDVANTIISLNVDYTEAITGVVNRRVNAYNIYDNYDDNGNLVINTNFDSRLQDPNQFKAGDKVRMIVPTHQQMVDYGRADYSIATHADESSNVESLPIAFIDSNDKIIGFLPTTDNVRKRVQKDHLDNAIRENVNLRQSIFENQSAVHEVTITSKTTGTPLFNNNYTPIYTSLGNGERLSEGVKIAVYKQGELKIGLHTAVKDNIKLPDGITPDQYFENGVVYSIVPTANEGEFFALPMNVSTIGESNARTIVKVLQLFRDKRLKSERDALANEIDLNNITEVTNLINNIIYINNEHDRYMFDINLKSGTLSLGLSKDLKFKLNDIVTDQSVQNQVIDILSKRYFTVRLADFGQRFNQYVVNEDNQLEQIRHKSYNDYLNNAEVLKINLQATPIEGTDKQYFTAQSVIEFTKPVISSNVQEVAEGESDSPVGLPQGSTEIAPKRKSRLRPKIRPSNNTTQIEEDLAELGDISNLSTEQQAEILMKLCE